MVYKPVAIRLLCLRFIYQPASFFIYQANEREISGLTREEAVSYLTSLTGQVSMLVQYRKEGEWSKNLDLPQETIFCIKGMACQICHSPGKENLNNSVKKSESVPNNLNDSLYFCLSHLGNTHYSTHNVVFDECSFISSV